MYMKEGLESILKKVEDIRNLLGQLEGGFASVHSGDSPAIAFGQNRNCGGNCKRKCGVDNFNYVAGCGTKIT
jgi:hypothetical protein